MFIFYQLILIKQNSLVYNNCTISYRTPFMTNGCNIRGRREELRTQDGLICKSLNEV